jgi:hypothetical protein
MPRSPIYEVAQIKGDCEARPAYSPNDAFADDDTWDRGDFGLNAKKPEMLPHEQAGSALKLGLEQDGRLGANPFKFGAIGEPLLATFWQDLEFDPALQAIYYVRVLEIPTPTWLADDRAQLGPRFRENACWSIRNGRIPARSGTHPVSAQRTPRQRPHPPTGYGENQIGEV